MAMTIRLQGEDCEKIDEVHDPQGLLVSCLPLLIDQSYHCLRFIDPYGDTYFNRMQIETFSAEWDRIFDKVQEKETKRLSVAIKSLAQRSQQEQHLYLKFLGD
jgi:hypothetical protein